MRAPISFNAVGNSKSKLGDFFRRLAYRKGRMIAITATGRKLAVIIYQMLTKKQPFLYSFSNDDVAKQFDYFLEVNFEEQRTVHALFQRDLDPIELCENLSIFYNIPIIPGKTLLFFDEIQACIPAISSLRFFYEKYP